MHGHNLKNRPRHKFIDQVGMPATTAAAALIKPAFAFAPHWRYFKGRRRDGSLTELIKLLEKLKSTGIINRYAIGGATALVYYFEPINTIDIDVFIILASPDKPLVNLAPLYDFLSKAGCKVEREYVLIDQIPVQFLIPYNDLLEEAVNRCKRVNYASQKVNIISLEYLMAIMVQTGRLKDKARLSEIERHVPYDRTLFIKILNKFSLRKKWLKIKDEIHE